MQYCITVLNKVIAILQGTAESFSTTATESSSFKEVLMESASTTERDGGGVNYMPIDLGDGEDSNGGNLDRPNLVERSSDKPMVVTTERITTDVKVANDPDVNKETSTNNSGSGVENVPATESSLVVNGSIKDDDDGTKIGRGSTDIIPSTDVVKISSDDTSWDIKPVLNQVRVSEQSGDGHGVFGYQDVAKDHRGMDCVQLLPSRCCDNYSFARSGNSTSNRNDVAPDSGVPTEQPTAREVLSGEGKRKFKSF